MSISIQVLPVMVEGIRMKIEDHVLDLNRVDYKKHYILAFASSGQIMRAFVETTKKSRLRNPVNNYEAILFPGMIQLISELVNKYQNILKCDNDEEWYVKNCELVGAFPTKLISKLNTRDDTSENLTDLKNLTDHHFMNLHTANIGKLIQAEYQRIDHKLMNIPSFYSDNPKYIPAFKKMQEQLMIFRKDLEKFEQDFKILIDRAHKNRLI